jgi:hypothetical protein
VYAALVAAVAHAPVVHPYRRELTDGSEGCPGLQTGREFGLHQERPGVAGAVRASSAPASGQRCHSNHQ